MAFHIEIKRDTFTKTGEDVLRYKVGKEQVESPYDVGTVEVSLDGGRKVVTAQASRYPAKEGECAESIFVKGFVGRYVSGAKVWRATVCTSGNGTRVWFGRDDRSGKFKKSGEVWFEPEMWERIAAK